MRLPKFKKRKKNNIIPVFLLLCSVSIAKAQMPITCAAAIDSALQQNPAVMVATLRTAAAKQFEASAYDIPLTAVSAEYGKINSVYNDTKFGITQAISFPVVYKRQKALLQAHTQYDIYNEVIIKQELKKQVCLLYYNMLVLQEKKKLLQKTDSLYRIFFEKQQQRFKAGDANILEKTTAEVQLMQVKNQLELLDTDFKIAQEQFGKLLHTDVQYIPAPEKSKISNIKEPDPSVISGLPAVKLKEQQQLIAAKEIEVIKSRSLPQLNVGYTNQSIIGIQNINGTDKNYTASNRFSSALLGLNIPLFNKANKARLAAGKTSIAVTKAEYENSVLQQQSVLQALVLKKQKHETQLRYFENTGLPQAATITENANIQFSKGAINYLEWIMLTNQSISIQAEYINAIAEWNTTIIELNAFLNN